MRGNSYQWLARAKREGWAIGAFNAANIETLKAIIEAAKNLESPVIIESSSGETEYFGAKAMRSVVDIYAREAGVPVLLNLDHASDPEAVEQAIKIDFDLIHFDGSKLPYEENVARTKDVVRDAHAHDLLVEGEIDRIVGSSDIHRDKKTADVQKTGTYTTPGSARDFVKLTGIDTLAVFIGNVHGIYADSPVLDIARLKKIRKEVSCFLSLHGGSGIADEDIKSAIAAGITKINVNSELRLAFLQSLQKAVKKPEEIAVYKIMPPVINAVRHVVEQKIALFGSAGKAKKRWKKRMIV